MSDIGFYGLEAAIVGLAMLIVAALGAFVEWVLGRKPRYRSAGPSVGYIMAGIYALLGSGLLLIAEYGTLVLKSAVDRSSWWVAGIGLTAWIVLRSGAYRKRPAVRREGPVA